jgi:hypothetical protein
MTLPVKARVEAAPNFLSNLEATHLFFVEQDADSATERFRRFFVLPYPLSKLGNLCDFFN